MEAHIFVEGSETTAEDEELPLKKYYQGTFGMPANLHDEIGEYADTNLWIGSEEFGLVDGLNSPKSIRSNKETPVGSEVMIEEIKGGLTDAARRADVMVVLLSKRVFEAAVQAIWAELVESAKPESIWCLGAPRSSLNAINFDSLESKGCTLLTYERVGVARLGRDIRKSLLEKVEEEAA